MKQYSLELQKELVRLLDYEAESQSPFSQTPEWKQFVDTVERAVRAGVDVVSELKSVHTECSQRYESARGAFGNADFRWSPVRPEMAVAKARLEEAIASAARS